MFCASVDLQGLIVRLLARKRPVFRETLSISSQNLNKKLSERNAFDPRGRGCYSIGLVKTLNVTQNAIAEHSYKKL